ncbi:unnamed protein product [Taenia asiatica]|uniref:Glyco_trans_2-like domain-containing protein n=1 Tax=Taenia asiatica TaxID=60517 RepID=A0A3P6PCZ8_TAEAS|nr:unnamed protein product [Taenia asiatica]
MPGSNNVDFQGIKGVVRSLRNYIHTNASPANTDGIFALVSEMADHVCENLSILDVRMKFEDVCSLTCMFCGLELSLVKDYQSEKPLELENRRFCLGNEFRDNYKLKLLKKLIPDRVRSSLATEVTRAITEACASTKLADAPCTVTFSGKVDKNVSVQFLLLCMRYFASASFGKFLTPDVSITNESADRTQATISTACTAWLSSVGAAVGLPTSGLLLSSSVGHLCEIVLDKLLPMALAFVMSSDAKHGESFADMVLAFFNPLIKFLSGSTENGNLAHQIVEIMVGGGNFPCANDVQKHLERMSSAITDLLVLRTLCEILCSVLQDTNLTMVHGKSPNVNDFLEEIVLTLTQFGKQFDSIVRQLADRITEVGIQHSKFVCNDTSSYQPVEKLLKTLSMGEFDATASADKGLEVGLSDWSFFMNELWKLFCATCPAGLARQMYTRVAAETLVHIVHAVANATLANDDEVKNMMSFIWSTLRETHQLIFRCVETEAEILSQGLLSSDLQIIHFSGLMLTQCLVVFGAPMEIISKVHSNGFFSGLSNGSFSVPFEPSNWLKIIDPHRFCQSSKEAQELLVMFRHFGSNPYFDPVSALKANWDSKAICTFIAEPQFTSNNLTFFDNGRLLKPLLHSPSWVNSEQSGSDRESIFAVYKACFELFAIADFTNDCYGNILTPLFESARDSGILDIEGSSPYPVWFEAFIDFIADSMQPVFTKLCDLALDRTIVSEIRTNFIADSVCERGGPSSESAKETFLCSLSPDFTPQCVELIDELYSVAMEKLPPMLLMFFGQQGAALSHQDESHPSVGDSVAIQVVLASLKRRVDNSAINSNVKLECRRILSKITDTLTDDSREEIISSRENFGRCLKAYSDYDSFLIERKTPGERHFQITQQLRLVQHSDFTALLTLHEVLKCNLDLIQDVYMRTSDIKSSNTLRKTLAKPKLNGSPVMLFTNESVSIEVSVIRNTARQGLIRSRIIGANEASGEVLVFADSHIRFDKDWLQSLVLRLLHFEQFKSSSHLLVLSPFISAFTEDGQDYPATDYLRGGFDWDLNFVWEPMTDEEKDNLNTYGSQLNLTWLSLPRPSPAIAGSVIAMNRNRFKALGAFDDQLEIWGGENIELSLRAWMCGGRVEIVPCSRVSHLFRSSHGYSFPKGKMTTIMQNLKRVAMIWMQHSRDLQIDSVRYPVPPIALFYSSQQEALKIPAGDLTIRERLRQQLECKDFVWFVDNVYPDLRRKGNDVKLRDNAMIKAKLSKLISKLK